MREQQQGPSGEPADSIEWEQVKPETFEEATVRRATLCDVARLLGYDADTVQSIEMDPKGITVRRVVRQPGNEGAPWKFTEHHKRVL